MRGPILAALVAFAPASASHADIGSDFETAFQIFLPAGGGDAEFGPDQVIEMVSAIEGHWIPGGYIFSDSVYRSEDAIRSCQTVSFEIVPTGQATFDLLQVTPDGPTGHRVSYSWVTATTFSRSADLDGQLRYIYRDEVDLAEPEDWARVPSSGALHGYANLLMVGPDVLVVQAIQTGPMILTRCP